MRTLADAVDAPKPRNAAARQERRFKKSPTREPRMLLASTQGLISARPLAALAATGSANPAWILRGPARPRARQGTDPPHGLRRQCYALDFAAVAEPQLH